MGCVPVQCPATRPLPGNVDLLITKLRLLSIFSRAKSVAMDSVSPGKTKNCEYSYNGTNCNSSHLLLQHYTN